MARSGRHQGDASRLDIKGRPVGRRATPVLRRSDEEAQRLRPLYQLGERFHSARTALVAAGEATDAALEKFGWRSTARLMAATEFSFDRSAPILSQSTEAKRIVTMSAGAWREAMAALLESTGELEVAAGAVERLGFRRLATAVREVAGTACAIACGAPGDVWRAVKLGMVLARYDDESDLRFGMQPWSHFAMCGWTWAAEKRSWQQVWSARATLYELRGLPDGTIGAAAGISADGARKARARAAEAGWFSW